MTAVDVNGMAADLVHTGECAITLPELLGLLVAACSSTRADAWPTASALGYWAAVHTADPDAATAAWREAWAATEPTHRLALLLIANQIPGLDGHN